MKNSFYTHNDSVRDFNYEVFRKTTESLGNKLSQTLESIMSADAPLDECIGKCFSFMDSVIETTAREMQIGYSMTIGVAKDSESSLDITITHNLEYTPTEALLDGRTDRLPVKRCAPDIQYWEV